MRKILITVAVSAALMTAGAQAAERQISHGEKIGLGVGMVIGTAGGPPGAVFGAILGSSLGRLASRANQANRLQAQVQDLESESEGYRVESVQLRQSLAEARAAIGAARVQLASQLPGEQVADSMGFDLLFRTGQSDLDEEYLPRLYQLGSLLQEHSDLQLQLDGFADQRGETTFNQQLSEARIEAVRQALEQVGLDAGRIQATAWGESASTAADGDLDGYAMERKVRVRLLAPVSAMSALDAQP